MVTAGSSGFIDAYTDVPWEAPEDEARSLAEHFMGAKDMVGSDMGEFPLQTRTVIANDKKVTETIRIDRAASEVMHQPLHSDTGGLVHEERHCDVE